MNAQDLFAEELRALEERLLQPDVRGSGEALAGFLADDFVEFGVSGRVFGFRDVVKGLPQAPPIRITISDFRARLLAPDVALVTYKVCKHDEPRPEMRHSLRSSIWTRLDNRWRVLFHQGTPARGILTEETMNRS